MTFLKGQKVKIEDFMGIYSPAEVMRNCYDNEEVCFVLIEGCTIGTWVPVDKIK